MRIYLVNLLIADLIQAIGQSSWLYISRRAISHHLATGGTIHIRWISDEVSLLPSPSKSGTKYECALTAHNGRIFMHSARYLLGVISLRLRFTDQSTSSAIERNRRSKRSFDVRFQTSCASDRS